MSDDDNRNADILQVLNQNNVIGIHANFDWSLNLDDVVLLYFI